MTAAVQARVPAASAPVLSRAALAVLQRKCACEADPGFEEENRRKRLDGALQARLAVNRPGDAWEQEADRLAEAALARGASGRRSSGGPGWGPEIASYLPVMRRPRPAASDQDAPESIREALASPAEPLEAAAQDFMQARFGHDFSRVRVHRDRQAAQSARAMGALAYTVGEHIVFGEGQFAPDSSDGRRLLAHELAHTIQQGSAVPLIRRQATTLQVEGLYEARTAEPNSVFFDLDKPTSAEVQGNTGVDDREKTKVVDKAQTALASNQQTMMLYGFASEEGAAAHNQALVGRRLEAVQELLVRSGFTPPRKIMPVPRLDCSRGKYDYRYWRAVEMRDGTQATTRECTPSALQPGVCPTDRQAQINDIRTAALKRIENPQQGALTQMDHFLQDPAANPKVGQSLDRYFGGDHSDANARAVRERITAVRDFINSLGTSGGGTIACGSVDEPSCHTGSPANASHSRQRMVFCPTYFESSEFIPLQVEIMLHEASHASRFATDDRAYQSERVILILNRDQALANAQSVTDIILELSGGARPLGPQPRDVVTDCDAPGAGTTHEQAVREAMAWAQRWNTFGRQISSQTYASPRLTAFTAPLMRAHGFSTERASIAGMYDRYAAMRSWFALYYKIRCLPASDQACAGGRLVEWNLTAPASPASGGPLEQTGSYGGASGGASAQSSGSNAGSGTAGAAPQATGSGEGGSASQSTGSTASTGQGATAATSTASTPSAPGGTITICPGFFSLGSPEERIVEIYSGLAVHLPGVTDSIGRDLARLAHDYMDLALRP